MRPSNAPYDRLIDVREPPKAESPAAVVCPLSMMADEPLRLDQLDHDSCAEPAIEGCPLGDLLEERLQFEKLLVELSTSFVNLPVDKIDEQIGYGLERLGRFLGIDRSSFAAFSEDKRDMVVTHCYVAPGIRPFPRVVVDGKLPWYAEQIRGGEVCSFARLPGDLPLEAVAEREYCVREGLKSNLAIPLKVAGSLGCVITFATFRTYRNWPDDLVERLWLIGQIFATSLARKRSEEQSQQLRDQLARMGRVTLVGELAAAIAHEINQPLCAIVSNAQAGQRMLAAGNADLSELRETLYDIAVDSRCATDVVVRIRLTFTDPSSLCTVEGRTGSSLTRC